MGSSNINIVIPGLNSSSLQDLSSNLIKWDLEFNYDISLSIVRNLCIFGLSGEYNNTTTASDLRFIVTPYGLTNFNTYINNNIINSLPSVYISNNNYNNNTNNCNSPAFWLDRSFNGFVSSYKYNKSLNGVTLSEFMAFSISQDQYNTYQGISVWKNLTNFYSSFNTSFISLFNSNLTNLYNTWCKSNTNLTIQNFNATASNNLYVNNTLIPPFAYSEFKSINSSNNLNSYNPSQLIYQSFALDLSYNFFSRYAYDISLNSDYFIYSYDYIPSTINPPNSIININSDI